MSKIENNRIYYDPYNEIRCDKFALEKFVKESEEKDKTIANLEAKLAESNESHHKNIVELTKIATEKDRKIDQLKQQLETQDNTITNLVEDNRASQEWYKKQLAESESRFQAHKQNDARIIQDQTDLIENLKQQLADTEEQNKRVLEKLELIVSANQELEKENELMAETLKMTKFIEKEVNQDKISFAVEQLERFRDIMEKLNENNSGYIIRFSSMIDREKFHEALDNQIKQLKEVK